MSNCLSDGPRYKRDGAAVEAGLDAFLQVGRQFLLVSRHLFLMAILARARIGLLLFGHRCFSPYSCLLGCPRMPGYPTRETLRTPLQACLLRRGAARAPRPRRESGGAGHAWSEEPPCQVHEHLCRTSERGPSESQRPEIAADHALLLASRCDRLAIRASDAELDDPRVHPARTCGARFPGRKAGVSARAAGARAGRPRPVSREPRRRRPHPGDSNTLHRLQGRLRVRRASAEMTHPTRAAGSPMSCAENISGGES